MEINTKHKVLAFFFSVLFAINILLPTVVLINFKINQDYISKNLCEEKEIEESTCNGNCQLKKSLAVIKKGTSSNQENFNIESHISFLSLPISFSYSVFLENETKVFFGFDNKNSLKGYSDIPFLPPILL